jgi:regulator of protease activity HflC (stomatin/prohibitin superfamily)
LSQDFQPVTVQGQITYRVVAPETTAGLLNFTINPDTHDYLSDDPAKLNQRIINLVQMYARQDLGQLALEEALSRAETIARTVLARLQAEPALSALGIECLSLFFTAIKPTPEMAKALEAEYREALQKRADQAIYSRRAEAVEQERKIKQNRCHRGRARAAPPEPGEPAKAPTPPAGRVRGRGHAHPPRALARTRRATDLAIALHDLAANAGKIGNLTITSEILEQC